MAPPTALVATPHLFETNKGVKHLVDSTPALCTVPSAYVVPDPRILATPLVAPPSSNFPIIDFSKLDSATDGASVVQDIVSACEDGGFFLVVNHGIKPSVMADFLCAAEAFFALPLEEKMKYASDFHDMAPVCYGSTQNDDASQPRQFWRDYLRHFDRPVDPVNCHLWPTAPSNYTAAAKEFLKGTWELAAQLAAVISQGLGKEPDYLLRTFGEGMQAVSCNYYPPCPQPELAVGVGAHIDPPAISILMDNQVDGLQFRNKGGEWMPVPQVPGAVVASLGCYMERASGGKMKAARHRVVVSETACRVSVAVGNGPELKALGSHPFVHHY